MNFCSNCFFFKHKTAYDVRISDWSSDVCSSDLLLAMAEEATRLFGLAMDSYADGNAALGNALDDLDDRLDQLHREYIKTIVQLDANEIDIQMIVQLGLVGRYYARNGDHAVNIGAGVGHIVTGGIPENTGAARGAARGRQPNPKTGEARPAPAAAAPTAPKETNKKQE